MRIIIAPAKKMNIDADGLFPVHMPQFLDKTEILLGALQSMDYAALRWLWRCNDSIATLNYERIQTMDLTKNVTPAILAYEGIQYQYMAPSVFENNQYKYINEHLYILSGFYGLLRPFDGVVPYRLEMQARLSVNGYKNLYDFWGGQLACQLCSETDFILNLASQEYSKAISHYLPKSVRFLTCTFGERKDGRVVEKGTICKMARGEMVRWLAENNITVPDDVKGFHRLEYAFDEELSTNENFVFVKKKLHSKQAEANEQKPW